MAKKTTFHFGKAFEQLEALVESLEQGEKDLQDAVKDYEEGLQLVAECKKQLSLVENKVKVIRDKYAEPEE